MNDEVVDERLMTIADLSKMLGAPIATLYGWRHRGEGPKGYRVGRHVRCRRAGVEAGLEEQTDRRQSARESAHGPNRATSHSSAGPLWPSSSRHPVQGALSRRERKAALRNQRCGWSMPSV
jgi:predicted DNA-binding transcriptional regulator AlpA